jgi:hypothetical protein
MFVSAFTTILVQVQSNPIFSFWSSAMDYGLRWTMVFDRAGRRNPSHLLTDSLSHIYGRLCIDPTKAGGWNS